MNKVRLSCDKLQPTLCKSKPRAVALGVHGPISKALSERQDHDEDEPMVVLIERRRRLFAAPLARFKDG